MQKERGKFISFEGIEGSGKSSQLILLQSALQKVGKEVFLTREPGGTVIGEKIREILQTDREAGKEMTNECELLLFSASRTQLVQKQIQPLLDNGTFVLADRYVDSTTVYQGFARKIPFEKIDVINEFVTNKCLPELTFIMDMPPESGMERILSRIDPNSKKNQELDRFEREPISFHKMVREGYLKIAEREPSRFIILDARKSIEEIHHKIINIVEERFNCGFFSS